MNTLTSLVSRMSALQPLGQGLLAPDIQVLQAQYHRQIPAHYRGNSHVQEAVVVNILLVENGRLVVPETPQTSFEGFYRQLHHDNGPLMRRIVSPTGTAKSTTTSHVTPIKEITAMFLAGLRLPGEAQQYGWHAMQAESAADDLALTVLFQGNGLYYNRGSAVFDGARILNYPDCFLADMLLEELPAAQREEIALSDERLKRPLLFFVTTQGGQMEPYLHRFTADESYWQGMVRLEDHFRRQGVRAALAASPPLVIPDAQKGPVYVSLAEMLSQYHANDVRHSLYCPYEGAVLLSSELGREQCLRPEVLAQALSSPEGQPVRLRLAETLGFFTARELEAILERKGYAGRFSIDTQDGQVYLTIRPLEGVYSHLLPFLTRSGVFGLVQTSGTHGSITGNDGPTLPQLSAMLQDINRQPPFIDDPIIAAASGAQGNDVPNVVCRSASGIPGLLAALLPAASLDESRVPRGIVTTPRVGIAVPKAGA